MMSRKNYNALAEMFGEAHATIQLLQEDTPDMFVEGQGMAIRANRVLLGMRHSLCLYLKEDNPRFDLARFDDAIASVSKRIIAQDQLPDKTPY